MGDNAATDLVEPSPSAVACEAERPLPALVTEDVRERARHAARCVRNVYPGAVGELLSMELTSWDTFGYRFGGQLMIRVIEQVLTAEDQRARR